jgi:predicted small lipoprotein YifL
MVDRIEEMDRRTNSRLAASVSLAAAVLGASGLLAACGQKGPLYLPETAPSTASTSARAHAPSAPEGTMPSAPSPTSGSSAPG